MMHHANATFAVAVRELRPFRRSGRANAASYLLARDDTSILMVSLLRQSDFRSVQDLPFCYLCGEQFIAGDSQNRDHVPPECIFAPLDRDPLWLPAHTVCNKSYGLMDEKIGQLIALRYGKVPRNPGHRRLKFAVSPQRNLGAVVNLDIDAAVWR